MVSQRGLGREDQSGATEPSEGTGLGPESVQLRVVNLDTCRDQSAGWVGGGHRVLSQAGDRVGH